MLDHIVASIGLFFGVALICGAIKVALVVISDYINGDSYEEILDKLFAVIWMLGSSFYVLYGSYCVMFK